MTDFLMKNHCIDAAWKAQAPKEHIRLHSCAVTVKPFLADGIKEDGRVTPVGGARLFDVP